MRTEVQDVLTKRDEISTLDTQISDAIREAQARSVKELPSFEEYGWSRLSFFSKRLRDALDEPLAEEVRRILEKAGLLLDSTIIKDAVREKRQGLLDTAKTTVAELLAVKEPDVRKRALDDVGALLKRGLWDDGISRSKQWAIFSGKYSELVGKPVNKIRALALSEMLEQGPDSSVLTQYDTMNKQAVALGGTDLWDALARTAYKTLNDVKNSLYGISAAKADLEQVKGEKSNIDSLVKKKSTMVTIQDGIQKEIGECRNQLSQKLTEVNMLLNRVNNLARLAEQDQEQARQLASLKEAVEYSSYLQKRLDQLRLSIQQSLNEDAINLAECLAQKRLPSDLTDAKILQALKDLLEKYSFKLEA
jgi:hypothetical protein